MGENTPAPSLPLEEGKPASLGGRLPGRLVGSELEVAAWEWMLNMASYVQPSPSWSLSNTLRGREERTLETLWAPAGGHAREAMLKGMPQTHLLKKKTGLFYSRHCPILSQHWLLPVCSKASCGTFVNCLRLVYIPPIHTDHRNTNRFGGEKNEAKFLLVPCPSPCFPPTVMAALWKLCCLKGTAKIL